MIVLVSDTSVLIDLERGGLLEVAFSCGHQLVVPDLLYVLELEPENGPLLKAMAYFPQVESRIWREFPVQTGGR